MNRRSLITALAAIALGRVQANAADSAALPSLVPIAIGLDHPWGMAFLPDGRVLVTERSGRLRLIEIETAVVSPPLAGLPPIFVQGQGGLLDIALDPDFASNRRLFLSYAEPRENGSSTSVFRARLSADAASLEHGITIFRQNVALPGEQHFGSRLVFDRDGQLFVTTGDRNHRDHVQDPATHIGKILRISVDGTPAPGNPQKQGWAPEVWSIGHRNAQGAALHPETGRLWTVEHGARGGDEINAPEAGKNYGWPVISYGREYSFLPIGEGQAKEGMEQPLHYWDPSIAPSGMAFVTSNLYPGWKGSLIVGALAGQHLARLTLDGMRIIGEERLFQGFARFRAVTQGPDGRVYVLTDEAAPKGGLYVIAAPGQAASSGSGG